MIYDRQHSVFKENLYSDNSKRADAVGLEQPVAEVEIAGQPQIDIVRHADQQRAQHQQAGAGMGRFQHQVAIRSPEAVEIHKANRDAKHDDEGSSSEPAQEQNRFRQRLQCWQTLKGAGTEVHDDH